MEDSIITDESHDEKQAVGAGSDSMVPSRKLKIACEEYKVKLEVFEGPLDLLLYLIKKDEVDIYDIPIRLVTQQYMETLDLMRMLDLDIAGEFLVMAATLMMIKSRMLLPVEDRPEMDDEEDDPRWELIRKLVEYKKFKDVAGYLYDMEERQENIFNRGTENIAVEQEPMVGLDDDVSIFDLISALNVALQNVKAEDVKEIFADQFTVADKIEGILERVKREEKIPFSSLFQNMAERHEIACTFLALLELIRLKQIKAFQKIAFGEIMIVSAN